MIDEKEIPEILKERGPMPGKELVELVGEDIFHIWRRCALSRDIAKEVVGKRYLRLDRNVDGYARLSPSVQREFMTYTVVGAKEDADAVESLAKELESEIKNISARKETAARKAMESVIERLKGNGNRVEEEVCFILGGDVPLGMAHQDPRPETSTGLLVAGSDLDLVIIHPDGFGEDEVRRLDDAVYAEKYTLLNSPRQKEEIDYIIKSLSRIKEQARFQVFEDMVACKIVMEGKLLLGSRELYHEVVSAMKEGGIPGKLEDLERRARDFRELSEAHLLKTRDLSDEDLLRYFATTEEIGEIY